MIFRYFDADGRRLTTDELRSMNIITPAMEHIFAVVTERMEQTKLHTKELE